MQRVFTSYSLIHFIQKINFEILQTIFIYILNEITTSVVLEENLYYFKFNNELFMSIFHLD